MSKRVLFLCVANSARSQIAQGILTSLSNGKMDVSSAGSKPTKLNEYTVKVMAEIGIDISSHYAKHFTEVNDEDGFDYVISVCSDSEAECPIFMGKVNRRLRWVFDDPADCTTEHDCMSKFRVTRDSIRNRIESWLLGLV